MFDQIYLTGFKIFGTAKNNPTEDVVNEIIKQTIPNVICNVLQVSTVDCDQYIQQVQKEVQNKKGKRILHLHLGMRNRKQYQIETYAYNNKNFNIKDKNGYQPRQQKISLDFELQKPLKTNFQIEILHNDVNKNGFHAQISNDPGRYICNYIYFQSLHQISNKYQNNSSLFIHFPTHEFIHHQANIKFVNFLISAFLIRQKQTAPLTKFDQIYLTGFKVFGSHQVNPTEQVVNYMKGQNIPNLTCSIVQVTTIDADKYISCMQKETDDKKDKKILHLHFGVGNSHIYHLQNNAYNNKNFGIPDNVGYQPRHEQITLDLELEKSHNTKLDLKILKEVLQQNGFPSQISTNPGRYLCNYIYFRSLHELSLKNQNHFSLFIHFPPHVYISHETNTKFVNFLIGSLLTKKNISEE